jgi:hypothetical protein
MYLSLSIRLILKNFVRALNKIYSLKNHYKTRKFKVLSGFILCFFMFSIQIIKILKEKNK